MPTDDEYDEIISESNERSAGLSMALRELLDAIDARWEGATKRQRENAISPRMEEAIEAARRELD